MNVIFKDEGVDHRTPEQIERDELREHKRHFPAGPKPTPPRTPAHKLKRRRARDARKANR